MIYSITYENTGKKTWEIITNNAIPGAEPEEYRLGTLLVDFLNFDLNQFRYGEVHDIGQTEGEESQVVVNRHNFEGYTGEDADWDNEQIRYEYEMNEDIPLFLRMYLPDWVDKENKSYKEEGYKQMLEYQQNLRTAVDYIYQIEHKRSELTQDYEFHTFGDSECEVYREEKYAQWNTNLMEIQKRSEECPEDIPAQTSIRDRYLAVCGRIELARWKNMLNKGTLDYDILSLWDALQIELYSTIRETRYIFNCQCCGLYTVAGKIGARFCDRGLVPVQYKKFDKEYLSMSFDYQKLYRDLQFEDYVEEKFGEDCSAEKREQLWDLITSGQIEEIEEIKKLAEKEKNEEDEKKKDLITKEKKREIEKVKQIACPEEPELYKDWLSCMRYATLVANKQKGKTEHPLKIAERGWINTVRAQLSKLLGSENVTDKSKKYDKATKMLDEAIDELDNRIKQYNKAASDEERAKIEADYKSLFIQASKVAGLSTDIDGETDTHRRAYLTHRGEKEIEEKKVIEEKKE